MQRISPVALGILAGIFSLVSLLGFIDPGILLEPQGIVVDSPAGNAELRAVYGGFFGGGAALFGLGSLRPDFRRIALLYATLLLAGFTIGRLLSGSLDGLPVGGAALGNLLVESAGFLLFLALLRSDGEKT